MLSLAIILFFSEDDWLWGLALFKIGIYIVVFILAIIIVRPIYRYYQQVKLRKYPDAQLLEEIKDKIRTLKQNGRNYNDIISELKLKYSYPKFMIRGFIIDVENEETTTIESPKTIVKSNFRFNYPKNWKIKPLDNNIDLDMEKYFSIEGSNSGIVTFCFFDNLMLQDLPSLNKLNKVIGNQYKNYKTKESITKWGRFIGKGNLFTAEVLNNTFSGKVFLYKSTNYGFYLSQGSMENDYDNVIAGFKMIEDSFERVK